ncbi:glycosyltransferase family 4 protein [Alsobacter sp. R-9]
MQIIFINRFYFPDFSATSQLLTDLAVSLAKDGLSVSVVTSRLRYDDPSVRLAASEDDRGVRIVRVWTSRLGRARLALRAVDYATFYVSALWALFRTASLGDVIVAKTDPPLIGIPAAWIARWRGATVVHWCQDLYPETAEALGFLPKDGWSARSLRRIRNATFRKARTCVVLGERMAGHLLNEGIPEDAISVVPNWVEETVISPLPRQDNPLRQAWDLDDRFVVAYSGNLGRAHEFDTLLAAAELLRSQSRLLFLFIGGGHGIERLRAEVAARGLAHLFQFRPYQDQAMLRQSLGVADAHWVSLRPELEGLIVPSKVYGIIAAGRPVIAVADPQGELGRMVARHDCGVCIAPGDGEALANEIGALADDPARVSRLGANGRAASETHYARSVALERWSAVLQGAAAGATEPSRSSH